MNEEAIIQIISGEFERVTAMIAMGDTFFIYDDDQKMPFATLVTGKEYDDASNVSRPGIYRLNMGVRKETFRALFGDADGEYDFTATDRLLPHPVYGRQHWVCVLNPSEATFATTVRPLLAEAYQVVVERQARRAARN